MAETGENGLLQTPLLRYWLLPSAGFHKYDTALFTTGHGERGSFLSFAGRSRLKARNRLWQTKEIFPPQAVQVFLPIGRPRTPMRGLPMGKKVE
jgi:hypothetical protein